MKVNLELYSPQMLNVFQKALRCAKEKGHRFLGSEHLLWGLAKETGFITEILGKYGLDANLIGEYISRYDNGAASGIGARAIQMSGRRIRFWDLHRIGQKKPDMRKQNRKIFSMELQGQKKALPRSFLRPLIFLWKT